MLLFSFNIKKKSLEIHRISLFDPLIYSTGQTYKIQSTVIQDKRERENRTQDKEKRQKRNIIGINSLLVHSSSLIEYFPTDTIQRHTVRGPTL